MKKHYLLGAATGVAVIMVLALVSATPAEAPVLCQYDGSGFSRSECLNDCASTYLGDDTMPFFLEENGRLAFGGGRGGGRVPTWAYNSCVLKCERSYWKNFDREFEDM